jgi:Spy/CpxP family protein refolding chaperone
MKNNVTKYLVVLMLFVLAGKGFAQPVDTPPDDRKDEITKILKQKFIDKVQVDDATADKFFRLYEDNNRKMKDINKQKREVMKYIEANPDAADIEQRLNDLMSLEEQALQQKKNFYNEAKGILTAKQLAQSIVLQSNFRKFLKEEIRKRKGKDGEKKRDRKRRGRN